MVASREFWWGRLFFEDVAGLEEARRGNRIGDARSFELCFLEMLRAIESIASEVSINLLLGEDGPLSPRAREGDSPVEARFLLA